MYKSKLVGKPLVLDVANLLKKIQESIRSIFRTYPVRTTGIAGAGNIGVGVSPARYWDAQLAKRERKRRAEFWRAAGTMTAFRNTIR